MELVLKKEEKTRRRGSQNKAQFALVQLSTCVRMLWNTTEELELERRQLVLGRGLMQQREKEKKAGERHWRKNRTV